jgi:hypothetical protein
LPKNILKHANAVPYLDSDTLRKISDDGNYSKTEREEIASNITAPGALPHKSAMGFLNSPRGASFLP